MTGRGYNRSGLSLDAVVVLALFTVFAASVIFVLLTGAGVYKNTASAVSDSFGARTAEAYIISKIRHFDAIGADGHPLVAIQRYGETDVLALYEENGGMRDATYIYYADGYIYELYTGAEQPFDPALGERIISARSLEFKRDDTLIEVKIDGGSAYAAPRCGVW